MEPKKRHIALVLPETIAGHFAGEHIKINNITDWQKTEVYVEGKKVNGVISQIQITIAVEHPTRIEIEFMEAP